MKRPYTVEDLMDKVFFTFDPDTSVPEAMDILGKKRLFGACVVNKSGDVLGMLSERRCLRLYNDAMTGKSSKSLDDVKVTEIMFADFKTVPKSMGIVEVVQLFLEIDHRRLPVVESGRMVGQITRRDLIKAIDNFV
ncbi:MAG: CBS domain-containing protein [Proteobacteria bacterium]|nr:CBS domain-containing protein [Pseudomonadota bacterium]